MDRRSPRLRAEVERRHAAHWGPGWSEYVFDDRAYLIRFKVDRTGAKPRLTHLCIEPKPGSDLSITKRTLQQVVPEVGGLVEQDTAWWEALAYDQDPLVSLPERWTDDYLPIVRDIWVRCQREGKSTRMVLMDLGVTASTADRLIRRSRAKWPEVMGLATRPGVPRNQGAPEGAEDGTQSR